MDVNLDKLERIFAMQADLDEVIREKFALEGPADEWVQKIYTALIVEATEVLEETNYKWWKKERVVDRQALREEMIDVLHFWVSGCLRMGFLPDEIFTAYEAKWQENVKRQAGLSDKEGYV